jgi:hypothetical protein
MDRLLRLALIVYILVLVYSGALAIYYLFLNAQTRLWRISSAQRSGFGVNQENKCSPLRVLFYESCFISSKNRFTLRFHYGIIESINVCFIDMA